MKGSLDDLHGNTIVARIEVVMDRAGRCRVQGSITDREFATYMLSTAQDVINGYHGRAKLMGGNAILVPANDTALVGTNAEKTLLAARDELADAMSKH